MAKVNPLRIDWDDGAPGECDRCGAMIANSRFREHEDWHENLTDVISLLQALAEGGKRIPWDAVKRTMAKMSQEDGST